MLEEARQKVQHLLNYSKIQKRTAQWNPGFLTCFVGSYHQSARSSADRFPREAFLRKQENINLTQSRNFNKYRLGNLTDKIKLPAVPTAGYLSCW